MCSFVFGFSLSALYFLSETASKAFVEFCFLPRWRAGKEATQIWGIEGLGRARGQQVSSVP